MSKFTDCEYFVDLEDGPGRKFALIKDSTIRIVPAVGDASPTLDDWFLNGPSDVKEASEFCSFTFDCDKLQYVRPIGLSRDVVAITASNGVNSVWLLTVSAGAPTFESTRLLLSSPGPSASFDAVFIDCRGTYAVCVVNGKADPVLSPVQPKSANIMTYSPLSGWIEYPALPAVQQLSPSLVKLMGDGLSFFAVYQTKPWEYMLVHSVGGIVWRGKLISAKSLTLSNDSKFLVWLGHDLSVHRPNSTHPRLFVMSTSDFSVTPVSEPGTLVVASGFLGRTNDVWFTVQQGVELVGSFKVSAETGDREQFFGPPISGPFASQRYYKTESLSQYPSVFDVVSGSRMGLPVSLAALGLKTEPWKHPTEPKVQGVMYSTAGVEGTGPIVLHLHGGPAMAVSPFRRSLLESSDWFIPLAEKGFKILSVTYRGSFGFRDEYSQASIGQQGVADLADVKAVVDVLGDRVVCILGGSYGGFLCVHAFASPAFAGVKKFIALYPYASSRSCAAETGDFAWETEYCNSTADNEFPIPQQCFQPDIIPKLYAADFSRPLMLFHGDSDDVCPISQSRQIYHILAQRGSQNVKLVTYRGEGHGFRQAENRKDCIARVLHFLADASRGK